MSYLDHHDLIYSLIYRTNSETYPNEIFPGRLYLGDWHHAADPHIIETLGITHILNITDSCENYLAESHRKYHERRQDTNNSNIS